MIGGTDTGPDVQTRTVDALVIGAGPAGLMAAQELARAGRRVLIAEAKPSAARKFLMAGKSGLNLGTPERSRIVIGRSWPSQPASSVSRSCAVCPARSG
jgi:predicted flavoprotein YhiN